MYSSIDVSPLVGTYLDSAMARADEICSTRNIKVSSDWVALVAAQMQAHAMLHLGDVMSQGFSKVTQAIESASEDAATVVEAAIGSMDATLVSVDHEISACGRQLSERLCGIEAALQNKLPEIRNCSTRGKPCQRGT